MKVSDLMNLITLLESIPTILSDEYPSILELKDELEDKQAEHENEARQAKIDLLAALDDAMGGFDDALSSVLDAAYAVRDA